MVRTAALALIVATVAHAEVTDSAANGFTVKSSWTIKAAPDAVFTNLLNVGEWWSPHHTFSGNAHNLSIEPKVGGCYCEKLPDGGGVRHMEVVYIVPGKILRMSGAMGPIQAMGVTAAMTIELKPVEGGATKLDLTYAAAGYMEKGMNTFAPILDRVLGEQFTSLKSFVETGGPAK